MAPLRDTQAAPETGRLCFSNLPGGAEDDLDAAFAAYALSCGDHPETPGSARQFFETHFTLGVPVDGHFTGYYEPELIGSLTRSAAFPVPLHPFPPGGCDLPRAQMDAEVGEPPLLYLRDEVDRFFLQVQGSGRIRLVDGGSLRVGYAGKNTHAYQSIGKLLIARGVFGPDITADALRDWLRRDPARGRAVMHENPSYVFFRILDTPPDSGPVGTQGCSVTPGRSLAVDPDHVPLGTPVWIEVDGLARLCIAQDTGSAIKGAGRADLFCGTGDAAGRRAGRLNHPGRFIPLVRR